MSVAEARRFFERMRTDYKLFGKLLGELQRAVDLARKISLERYTGYESHRKYLWNAKNIRDMLSERGFDCVGADLDAAAMEIEAELGSPLFPVLGFVIDCEAWVRFQAQASTKQEEAL